VPRKAIARYSANPIVMHDCLWINYKTAVR